MHKYVYVYMYISQIFVICDKLDHRARTHIHTHTRTHIRKHNLSTSHTHVHTRAHTHSDTHIHAYIFAEQTQKYSFGYCRCIFVVIELTHELKSD